MEFSELTNDELYNFCGFGLPGQSVPPHVDSDKMNFIAKNKCPDSQKLDTRHRGENLNARMCQDQEHVYVCTLCPLLVFDLFCEARRASENLTSNPKQS